MDNERKIRSSSVKNEFVDELLDSFKVDKIFAGNKYKVEEEFPKTKKNKASYFWHRMWAPLLIAIFVISAAAIGIGFYVSYQNKNIKVDTNTFEDLNLQALLSEISDAKTAYENEQKVLDSLLAEWENVKLSLERSRDSELFTLEQLFLEDQKIVDARKSEIEASYQMSLNSASDDYGHRIELQQEKVEEAKQALEDFQHNNADAFQRAEQSAVISTSQTLQQIQEQELKDRYESEVSELQEQMSTIQQSDYERQQQAIKEITDKYLAQIGRLDPELTEKKTKRIVNSTKVETKTEGFLATRWSSMIPDGATSEFRKAFQQYRTEYDDITSVGSIIGRALEVEHKKDIPVYFKAFQRMNLRAANNFAEASIEEIQNQIDIHEKIEDGLKGEIAKYKDLLEAVCTGDGVISASISNSKYECFVTTGKESVLGPAVVMRHENVISIGNLSREQGTVYFRPGTFVIDSDANLNSIHAPTEEEIEAEVETFENGVIQKGDTLIMLNLLPKPEGE